MKFIGKNKDFKVVWNCTEQIYKVFKNEKLLRVAFNFSDVKSYLD